LSESELGAGELGAGELGTGELAVQLHKEGYSNYRRLFLDVLELLSCCSTTP
jgi:hypothetical protein